MVPNIFPRNPGPLILFEILTVVHIPMKGTFHLVGGRQHLKPYTLQSKPQTAGFMGRSRTCASPGCQAYYSTSVRPNPCTFKQMDSYTNIVLKRESINPLIRPGPTYPRSPLGYLHFEKPFCFALKGSCFDEFARAFPFSSIP